MKNRRIGVIYVPNKDIESIATKNMLAILGFVPIKVENNWASGRFEMTGLSDRFDEVEGGMVAPKYSLFFDSSGLRVIRL